MGEATVFRVGRTRQSPPSSQAPIIVQTKGSAERFLNARSELCLLEDVERGSRSPQACLYIALPFVVIKFHVVHPAVVKKQAAEA